MHEKGFISLNRKILSWRWYTDVNAKSVFIHCLLKANYKEGNFKNVNIPRGSFVTSYQKLADETGLTVSKVRTALKNLELTRELTRTSHSKFLVITVNNYDLYQTNDTMNDIEMTLKSHRDSIEIATIEKSNKVIKEECNKELCSAPPTLTEVEEYFREKGFKHVDAEYFYSFYSNQEKPWTTPGGADVTRDWKNRARRWEKENAAKQKNSAGKPLKTRFHNFEQHEYDFEQLENQLFENL